VGGKKGGGQMRNSGRIRSRGKRGIFLSAHKLAEIKNGAARNGAKLAEQTTAKGTDTNRKPRVVLRCIYYPKLVLLYVTGLLEWNKVSLLQKRIC